VDKPVHARGFGGLLSRMQEQRKPEPTTEQLPRIDRAGARRLIASAGHDVGRDGGQQWGSAARSWFIKTSSWHAIVLYGAVLAGVMTASLEGPQHAWSSGGLLRSPPDSGAGGKEFTMMKKMSAVGIAAVMIASQTMAGGAVQWRVEDGGNGHWYEVSNLGPTMTGDSARQHAADRGGYLLSITSLEEDNFVQAIVTDLNAWGNEYLGPMIGMHRDGGDCWNGCWDSGEVVGYTHWHPGNPDGSLERCVYLYRYGICEWQDYACDLPGWGSRAVSAVVEWSADCNNDGIVDYSQCQDGSLPDTNTNNVPDCCESAIACSIQRQVPSQYATIQAAINAASNGDQVIVAPGTYLERINLGGKDIRLTGASGAGQTIIDGQDQGTVLAGSGEPSTCVIRGFTIMHGTDVSYSGGGGIALTGSSARFADCVIRDNTADGPAWWSGGGFHSVGGAPIIEDCVFINNRCKDQSAASAIYHYTGGAITIRRCTFQGNVCNYSASNGLNPGQAIKCHSEYTALTVLIEGCKFFENTTGVTTSSKNFGAEITLNASGLVADVRGCHFIAGYAGSPCAVAVSGGAGASVSNSSICGYLQPVGNLGGEISTIDCVVSATCEDCNHDGINDPEQIASEQTPDNNHNNIPDTCECIGDIYVDGIINGGDLGVLLAYWGPTTSAAASIACDLNVDGVVNGSDLGILLAYWGPCSN
jgi:hypothetical protein